MANLGIIESGGGESGAAFFRLLTNCVICPASGKFAPSLLSRTERRLWKWITRAGLRLTIAELTFLTERGIKPTAALLGPDNRQALTEAIYTAETIQDGILETLMESSPSRDATVDAVLMLLKKKKIFLI